LQTNKNTFRKIVVIFNELVADSFNRKIELLTVKDYS
jgi:hypothetical protein